MSRINLFSPSLNVADSYGLIADQLSRHLVTKGITVNAMGWSPTLVSSGNIDSDVPASDASFYLGWPTMYPAWPAQKGPRIAISMWESTILPAGWCDILNDMNAVIVPSEFCFEVFRDCGVTAPLHTIPLGVSCAYHPVKRDTSRIPMRFLAFLDRGKRKGGHVALAAFQKAFGTNLDYQLVLKIRTNAPRVELFPGGNIELVQQDMTEAGMCELYQSCDVFIGANSGEGFGLIPREFCATGGVALATDWGGTADDLIEWGWPIAYTLGPADWSGQPGLEGQLLGEWAMPDVEQLSYLLLDIADRPDFYRQQTTNAAANVRRLYSWQRFSEQVHEVWRGINLC